MPFGKIVLKIQMQNDNHIDAAKNMFMVINSNLRFSSVACLFDVTMPVTTTGSHRQFVIRYLKTWLIALAMSRIQILIS